MSDTVKDMVAKIPRPAKPGRKSAPWGSVTDKQVREIIAGTALEPIVQAFECPTVPSLPLSCALVKALPIVGCALSQKRDAIRIPDDKLRGDQLAKVRIESGGGQVPNFWSMVVGEPSSGKDIGYIDTRITAPRGWLLGSSGSAEGLADQYVQTGNGLLRIGELEPFIDPKHWQAKATSFLVQAFNLGWFATALSERSNSKPRETDFCYPNILASVQPQIISRHGAGLLENGFGNRFLIGSMPTMNWEVNCAPIGDRVDAAARALNCYANKAGTVIVPQGYLHDFQTKMLALDAPYRPYWRRLKNEYGARLAVVLSVSADDSSENIVLRSDIWERVELLCWWFYGMAHTVFENLLVNGKAADRERLIDRLYACICQHTPITKGDISRLAGRGTTAKEREEFLDELIERGRVELTDRGYVPCK